MTGIFSACAFFSSGIAALLSSAAKPSALRLLGERGREHVDLLVDHRLGFRALESDLDVELLRGLLGAELHRLPELMLEALRDRAGCRARRRDGAALEPAIAAAADAVQSSVSCSTSAFLLPCCCSASHSGLPCYPIRWRALRASCPPAPQDVGIDGEDDDQPGHHGLPFLRDRQDAQAVGQHAHDEGADDRAEYRARAAAQRRAADDDRGDRVELVALAERRLGRIEARGDQQPGDAADGAAQPVDRDLPASTLTPESRTASSLLPSAKV